jgi:hypothetical protein
VGSRNCGRECGGVARQSPAGNDVSKEAENIVVIRYWATTGEKTEDLASGVVNSKVCKLATEL